VISYLKYFSIIKIDHFIRTSSDYNSIFNMTNCLYFNRWWTKNLCNNQANLCSSNS